MDTKVVTKVADKDTATNFGAITMNGSTAYCIKTNSSDTKSVLFKYPKYTSSSKTTANFSNVMGHANGITFNNDSLWIATKTPKIIRIKPKESLNKYYTFNPASTVAKHYNISCITSYKDNTFLVKTGTSIYLEEKFPCLNYSVITFSGSKKEYSFKEYNTIKVINPKYKEKYTTTQDICYHNGKLYIILTKEGLKENAILVADLTKDIYAQDSTGTYFMPSEIFILNKTNYKKYEIESLDFNSQGKMIMASNILHPNQQDSILIENGITEIK